MDDATGGLDRIRLDAEGRIDIDLPCIDCGYNLRTRLPEGTCPECGNPVLPSTAPHLLHFADPAWLRRLIWGVGCVIYGVCWHFLPYPVQLLGLWKYSDVWDFWPGQFLSVALVAFVLVMLIRRIKRKIIRDVILVGTIIGIALVFPWLVALVSHHTIVRTDSILALVGWWLLTTPEPGRKEIPGKRSARKVARIAVAAAILGSSAYSLLFAGPPFLSQVAYAPIVAVHALGLIVAFGYLAGLAKRMPRPRLAKQAVTIGWCLGVLMALVHLNTMIQFIAPVALGAGGMVNAWENSLMASNWVTGISLEAVRLWALVLCILYARSLRRIARHAVGRTPESSPSEPGDAL